MVAVSHNFIVEKGEDVTWTLAASDPSGVPINHTGYGVEMDVRTDYNSSSTLLTFTVGNGRIAIDGSGAIVISLVGSDSAALTFDRGVYDIKVTDLLSDAKFYLRGQFFVKPTVTR